MIGAHLKFVIARDPGEEYVDLVMRYFDHITAPPAYQVVVGAILDRFVYRCARAKVRDRYQVLAGEVIQRAVNGGQVERGQLRFDSLVDFVRSPVFMFGINCFQDDRSGGGEAFGHSCFLYLRLLACAIISDNGGCGKGRYVKREA